MKLTRRKWIIGGSVLLLAAGIYQLTRLNAEQRLLAAGLVRLSAVVDAQAPRSTTLSTTLEVLRGDGLPKEALNVKIALQMAAPDRLHAATEIKGERIEIGRDGQELWAWQATKKFAVAGDASVPKYTGNPASVEKVTLGGMTLPDVKQALDRLPHFCAVKRLNEETVEGESCDVLHAKPLAAAKAVFDLPDAALTLWLRKSDAAPLRVEFADGKKLHLLVALHDLKLNQPVAESAWQLPAEARSHVQRVALAHLTKFLDTVPELINRPRTAPLGPATGERKLLAAHGEGRLEMHDGTRVLFLKGTPEEMGRQHGTLLAAQVRDVTRRILYGVGVGSSLAKGEWFFGTIERCQARIGKFIDPRHLREMDAIAQATGLDVEEVRLSNFFPELFHCSGFALHGAATQGGHLYHGRILDYMVGVGLEPNAVVIVSQPDDAHAWVNISYAGFTGSVTAMNDAKISIGEMGGRGEGHWDGKPMAQLVREVMEKAGTLDEAVEIMRASPRTCEYYYVIADGKTKQSVGIKATPDLFEVVLPGASHPQLVTPVADTVILSAGDRYVELARRVREGFGKFDADSARDLMTRPVCMNSNIHSVLFQTDTLDFWVANADADHPASHTRYTHYNLDELLHPKTAEP